MPMLDFSLYSCYDGDDFRSYTSGGIIMEINNTLTDGKLYPTLIKFTIPFLLSSLLQNLYGTVDLLVIGNFSTKANVSAVATGSQVMSLVTFFILGLTTGATVLIGQFLGARQYKTVAEVIGNSIFVFGGLSVLMMAIFLLVHPYILHLLNIPAEAETAANTYTMICCLGIPLIVGYNTVCAILRGMGDSKSPLIFVAIACVVNIAGDLLLSGALHMGAAGVAISTVAAQGISFISALLFLGRRGVGIPFSKGDLRFSMEMSKKILTLGIPMGIRSILVNLSFMLITSIINAMGVTYSAAMGVGDKIVGFAFLPQSSFATSISVIVAQNMGAGKPDRAKRATIYGMITCVVIGFIFFAYSQFFPTFLPSLFTNDAEVQVMCGMYIKAYSYDAILTSIVFCLSSMFTGCGKSTFTMAQDLASTFLIRVPVTYLVSRMADATLFQIGLAAPIASILGIVICLVYLKTGKWKSGVLVKT